MSDGKGALSADTPKAMIASSLMTALLKEFIDLSLEAVDDDEAREGQAGEPCRSRLFAMTYFGKSSSRGLVPGSPVCGLMFPRVE